MMDAHQAAAASLRAHYAPVPPARSATAPRLARRGRSPRQPVASGLDVSPFGKVLCVDPETRTAVAGGMTTYEDLADATLRHGLMPLVVPELKTITLGGAVTGLGIESSSLRSGIPHASATELALLHAAPPAVPAPAPSSPHPRSPRLT